MEAGIKAGDIFSVTGTGFDVLSLSVFRFQYQHNPVYRQFADGLNKDPGRVSEIASIPFLPVSLFKSHTIRTTEFVPEVVFESSGTTQTQNSHHEIRDLSLYQTSYMKGFHLFYGDIADWCIIGLLPAYLERPGSSLVMMTEGLIQASGHEKSGFYLYDHEKLHTVLEQLEQQKQKTLLIGVTFALVDFAMQYPMKLKYTTVMETGGMKGRRKEMTRHELHDLLKEQLGIVQVHSEYGMTELLSQAYSAGEGIFAVPPWMKAMIRNEDDPLDVHTSGSGILNMIDLANLYSCSFIATDDVGKLFENGNFEVLGRLDTSDLRGCSLLVL